MQSWPGSPPPLKNRLSGLRYRRVASGMGAGEFQDCSQWWPGSRHFMVIRRPVPGEPSPQLTLFQMGGYSYQALVTNLSLQALNLWQFYIRRARAELIIRELKCANALGKTPTNDFQANEALFQIVLLAYNLLTGSNVSVSQCTCSGSPCSVFANACSWCRPSCCDRVELRPCIWHRANLGRRTLWRPSGAFEDSGNRSKPADTPILQHSRRIDRNTEVIVFHGGFRSSLDCEGEIRSAIKFPPAFRSIHDTGKSPFR